jgi:DNA-binding XRE family transcriptional regulator
MTSENMTAQQTIMVDGKPYVLLPRDEYEKLTTLAKAADLPPLPQPDAKGNYPAVEYALASLARKIIRDRVAAGLTQRKLAKLAGISFEHLCRIETGKHIPGVPTIDKIDRALKQAMKPAKQTRKKGK